MYTAFQKNAFQNNAFQIAPTISAPGGDLGNVDQGLGFPSVSVYLGPTLGWTRSYLLPTRTVSVSGPIGAKDNIILVKTVSPITLTLPDVVAWANEPHYNPYNALAHGIWIKDLYGTFSVDNLTVTPFGAQTIDGLASLVVSVNRSTTRLYPLTNFAGWFVG